MYCSKCFKEIENDAPYCCHCGNRLNNTLKKLPTTNIAWGIISIVLSQTIFTFYGIIIGIIGVIFGVRCKKITKTPLILSIMGLSLSTVQWLSITIFILGYYLFYFLYFILIVLLLIFTDDKSYPLPGQFFM